MSLTAKDVAEIIRLLEQSSFDELELESGEQVAVADTGVPKSLAGIAEYVGEGAVLARKRTVERKAVANPGRRAARGSSFARSRMANVSSRAKRRGPKKNKKQSLSGKRIATLIRRAPKSARSRARKKSKANRPR